LVEAVIPLPGSTLQLLSPVDKAREKLSQEKHERGRDEGENSKFNGNTYPEDSPGGTPVDPQRLVQRIVERGIVVSKFLPQRLLGLGLVKVGRRRAGVPLLLLRVRNSDIRVGRPACDDEASVPCVGCRGTTQPSSRISSTPAGSGAGAGQFSHWPHPSGGASSSGITTTAARSPAVGTGAGGTANAVVVTTRLGKYRTTA
jgi:hypothetical protein